jgi:hypothetical protein
LYKMIDAKFVFNQWLFLSTVEVLSRWNGSSDSKNEDLSSKPNATKN